MYVTTKREGFMKNNKLLYLTLVVACVTATLQVLPSYDRVTVTNGTPFTIEVAANYPACSGDNWQIGPGQTVSAPSRRGVCLLTSLDAIIQEEMEGGVGVRGVKTIVRRNAAGYYSGPGTTYSKFLVVGPQYDTNGKTSYKVVRDTSG